MAKLFEDSLGNLEYLLLGLTFLGVMYLVMKQAKYTISLQRSGYTNLGPGMAAWAAQPSQGYASAEGFSSGGGEPPVWHSTPFDPTDYDQTSQVTHTNLDVDDGSVRMAAWSNVNLQPQSVVTLPNGDVKTTYTNGSFIVRNAAGNAVSSGGGNSVYRTQTEGAHGNRFERTVSYAKKDSMTDNLDKALAGYGTNLA
jgi:hypothetical protein